MIAIAPTVGVVSRPLVAGLTVAVLWVAAAVWYCPSHAELGPMAAGGAAYSAALAGVTVWLVRRPAGEDRLLATGKSAPLWAWYVVAGTVLAWAVLCGFAYAGNYGGVRVPYLTPWFADLCVWRASRGIDGSTLHSFVAYAVIPATVLLALRAKPREMGLWAPVPGTWLATVACLLLPLGFVIWGFVQGKLTISLLLVLLVHNFLSNGFSEEFMCRGLFLPTLRSVVPTGWAIVLQGLLFALIHVGGQIPEEGGDPLMAVAGAVALNLPMGLAMGVIAARTGSLALPTAIHIAGHLMIYVLQ